MSYLVVPIHIKHMYIGNVPVPMFAVSMFTEKCAQRNQQRKLVISNTYSITNHQIQHT